MITSCKSASEKLAGNWVTLNEEQMLIVPVSENYLHVSFGGEATKAFGRRPNGSYRESSDIEDGKEPLELKFDSDICILTYTASGFSSENTSALASGNAKIIYQKLYSKVE